MARTWLPLSSTSEAPRLRPIPSGPSVPAASPSTRNGELAPPDECWSWSSPAPRFRRGLIGGSGGAFWPVVVPARDLVLPSAGDCGRLTVGTRVVDMMNVGSEMSCLLTVLLLESFTVLVVVLYAGDCGADGRIPWIPLALGGFEVDPAAGDTKGSPSGEMGDGWPD
jgi:hypothetical protein